MADLVIVTNDSQARYVEQLGGRSIVCEDPLPDLAEYGRDNPCIEANRVLFVCSYDQDEPYQTVFNAVATLGREDIILSVSGNYDKAGIDPTDWPSIRFLGFVAEKEFYKEMATSVAVLDLTTNQDCLVCGAYEGLSLGKPVILTDTSAQKAYFQNAAIYVQPEAMSIANSIEYVLDNLVECKQSVESWCEWATQHNKARICALRNTITGWIRAEETT
jgi:glycosyltransferase involved in cell wall biosynthesis